MTTALVFMSGCKGKEQIDEKVTTGEMHELYEDIISFERENGFDSPTRGFWDKLGRVAAWDGTALLLTSEVPIGKYFISGLVSLFAAIFIFHEDASILDVGPQGTEQLLYSAPSLDQVGLEHNEFLMRVLQSTPGSASYSTPQEMVETIISSEIQNSQSVPFSGYEELRGAFPQIEQFFACKTEQDVFALCRNYVDNTEMVSVAEQVIGTISSLKESMDLSIYSEGVHSIIEQSAVANGQKERLLQVLSVASYSKALWDYEME